ncbi:MAG: hypothetical protein JW715_13225 [Sedimentisphaerales bacterium]|nr:hypothetical protein [Sedimentisphaerales bacterium]
MKQIRNPNEKFFSEFTSGHKLLVVTALVVILSGVSFGLEKPLKIVFEGIKSEHKWMIKELDTSMPSDWSDYNYLVMEMKLSTPQRFSLWLHTANGNRRVGLQLFGQNTWLRASVPLQFFRGENTQGSNLAAVINRRTNSFWMSVWGPFGDLKEVEALSVVMDYPIEKPVLEIRSIELSREDKGSEFLEGRPVVDEFGQWVNADWPRKIKSREQLEKELAEEEKNLKTDNFNVSKYGGYLDARIEATGFFRIEKIDGRWWFVDPDGYLFLAMGSNGIRSGRGSGGRGRFARTGGQERSNQASADRGNELLRKRMEAWGLNTIGNFSGVRGPAIEKAYVTTFRAPRTRVSHLGMSDVYAEDFLEQVDASAKRQCTALRNDPYLLGYFIGSEPPWLKRTSELVDMFLNGRDCATKTRLQEFLAEADTKERRSQFILGMYDRYLTAIKDAIKKYDPNHLILGMILAANPPAIIIEMNKRFDVTCINPYEYTPAGHIRKAYELTGGPIMIGEYHFGTPGNGLGSGLVPVIDLKERGVAYRYYIEQGASQPGFVGAFWFTWTDEPVLGRSDGENYNIGMIDSTGRAYPELVNAMIETHKRLYNVHAGKIEPFNQKPRASEDGTPSSPWVHLEGMVLED